MKRILTVCTGNLCRSPVAEGLLRDRLGAPAARVASAGVGAVVGHPATDEAVRTAAARGADISAHRAQQLDAALASEFDLLLAMDDPHLEWVARHVPDARDRTYLLGHWRGVRVPDPIGRDFEFYERVGDVIAACVDDWIPHLS